jgi:very-short-patch-repair endonuclease
LSKRKDVVRGARQRSMIRRAAVDSLKVDLARRFRREPTEAEATAWRILRNRRLMGLKFRRQQIIAGFVVDFYCPSLRLVLEIDGGVHNDPIRGENDFARMEILQKLSVSVLRIPNHAVCEATLRRMLAPLVPKR